MSVEEVQKGDVGIERTRRAQGERQVVFVGNPIAKVNLALHAIAPDATTSGSPSAASLAIAAEAVSLRDLGVPAPAEIVLSSSAAGKEKRRQLRQMAAKVAVEAIEAAFNQRSSAHSSAGRSQREAVSSFLLLGNDPLAPDLHARVASLLARQRRDPGPFDQYAIWVTLQSIVADKVEEAAEKFGAAVREALEHSDDDFKLGRFPRFLEDVEAECRRYYLEPAEFQGLDLAAIVGAVAERLPDEVRCQYSGTPMLKWTPSPHLPSPRRRTTWLASPHLALPRPAPPPGPASPRLTSSRLDLYVQAWVESTAAKRKELEAFVTEARQVEERLITLIHEGGSPPPALPSSGHGGCYTLDGLLSQSEHDAREELELADLQARGGPFFSNDGVELMVASAGRTPPYFQVCEAFCMCMCMRMHSM